MTLREDTAPVAPDYSLCNYRLPSLELRVNAPGGAPVLEQDDFPREVKGDTWRPIPNAVLQFEKYQNNEVVTKVVSAQEICKRGHIESCIPSTR